MGKEPARPRKRPRLGAFRVVGAVGIALVAFGSGMGVADAAPSLRVKGPANVRAGQPTVVEVILRGARNVVGWQASLHVDPRLVEVAGVTQPAGTLGAGRGVVPLGPIDTAQGVALGGASCATASCLGATGARSSSGASGRVVLARVRLLPLRSGPLTVSADGLQLVTAAARAGAKTDVDGNGRIDYSDLMQSTRAWEAAREAGRCSGASSGCTPVSDVQAVAAAVRPTAAAAVTPNVAMNFVVDSTADDPDAVQGNGICATAAGVCTLRAAILEANRNPGPDTISFAIPGSGVQTINVTSQLPSLSDQTGGTTIDGYTQPGASVNTSSLADNARIMVQIQGTGATLAFFGLFITSPNNVVRGLSMFNIRAMVMQGAAARNNRIVGNFIGTNAAGTFQFTTLLRDCSSIELNRGANQNRVGTPDLADRNVISGSAFTGIYFTDVGTNANLIQNNIIGLNPAGTNRIRNLRMGIDINLGASQNVIGGSGPGERNVISGNAGAAVEVSHTTNTVGNRIVNNFIGTDLTGTTVPSYTHNSEQGVHVEDGVQNTVIDGNVISDSLTGDLTIEGVSTSGTQVTNNLIGVNSIGTLLPNGAPWGIQIRFHAQRTTITGNKIARVPVGIRIDDSDNDFNTISRNGIYAISGGGLGIDLAPIGAVNPNDPGDTDAGANQQMNFPVLTSADSNVTGTSCPGCTVELFVADGPAGANGSGMTFIASTVVGASGTFTIPVGSGVAGANITSTATDPAGNTSEFSTNIADTLTPPPPDTTASDDFGRVVSDGWGTADTGGPWTPIAGAASDYNVDGSVGTMRLGTAGAPTHGMALNSVSTSDVDVLAKVSVDKLPTGSSVYVSLSARRGASDYRGRLRLANTGGVFLQAAHATGETEVFMGSEANTGFTYGAGTQVWVRMQVVGANPTTIRMRAWRDGTSEPGTWQYQATDSTAGLQGAGSVGVLSRLSGSTTNPPIVVSVDGVRVTAPSP
jgi:CSLREA domain-containing protein